MTNPMTDEQLAGLEALAADIAGDRLRSFRDEQTDLGRQIRIEAIRAASRIIGTAIADGVTFVNTKDRTLELAKHFARYIETGE